MSYKLCYCSSLALTALESPYLCAVSMVSLRTAELGWKIFFLWEAPSLPLNYSYYICCILLLTDIPG